MLHQRILVQEKRTLPGDPSRTSSRKVMALLKRQHNWAMLLFFRHLEAYCIVGYHPQVTGSMGR